MTDKATRGARIKLDINADSPIILLPHSSKSTDILVADLGKLTVNNCFIYDGEPGTLTFEQDDNGMKRTRSQESLSSMAKSESSEFSMGSSSAATGMTQSLFDSYNPPMASMGNPMLQSIYGSLEQDQRSPTSVVRENFEIYDPTETGSRPKLPRSPEGSSVDPEFFPDSSSLFYSSSSMTSQHRLRMNDSMREGKVRKTPSTSSLNRSRMVTSRTEADHVCLLDIMNIHLKDMNLYSAERVNKHSYDGSGQDLEFKSFMVQKQASQERIIGVHSRKLFTDIK